MTQMISWPGMVVHTCNPSTQRQRQKDHCKFKASLGYNELKATLNYIVRPGLKKKPGIWHTPVILVLRRLTREDHHEFEASLGYKVISGPVCIMQGNPISKKTKQSKGNSK